MKKTKLFAVISAALLSAAMIVPQFTVFAENSDNSGGSGDTVQTEKPPAGTPEFAWYNKQTFQVTAGTTAKFQVMFQNLSADGAYSTRVSLRSDKNAVDIKETLVSCGYVSRMGFAQFDMEVFVPKSTAAGRHTIEAVITGTNADQKQFTQTMNFYIDVVNTLADKGIMISDYSVSSEEVKPNDAFTLKLILENTSGTDISGVLVDIDGLDGTRFAMNDGLSTKKIDIKADEKKEVVYELIGCKGIASIREVLGVKLTYQLDNKNAESKQETTTNITVPCKPDKSNDPNEKIFAPDIIIDNYTYGGEYVTAGKTFPLNMTIRNTSSDVSIQNLKVTIQGAAGSGEKGVAYSPANSSNSFFFKNLGPNVSENISLDMLAKADAVPDSYPIEVIFDYEYTANDIKDKADGVKETLSIPLQQDDRFTANPPEIEEQCFIGQDLSISSTFVNKGKGSVYNVTVDVEGTGFDKTASSYYIGNVDSGKEEYYDTRIIPNIEGEIKGEIVVTYEDANGNEKEIRTPFVSNAMPSMNINDNMGFEDINGQFDEKGNPIMPVEGQTQGLPVWAIISICAGGAVIAIIAVIVIIKVVNKKKLAKIMAAESEDENENN